MARKRRKQQRQITNRIAETTLIERERCLAVLAMFKEAIGDYYIPIANRMRGGDDPRDPDYMVGRLMP